MLDWHSQYASPQANDTVSIFMRKVPATVAPKDYLGSILINPGVSCSALQCSDKASWYLGSIGPWRVGQRCCWQPRSQIE